MANNKLIAAALAGLLATVSPLAALAGEEAGKEANGCKGEAAKDATAPAAEAPKEGEANGCPSKTEEKKEEGAAH
jgi:hypothetical protein